MILAAIQHKKAIIIELKDIDEAYLDEMSAMPSFKDFENETEVSKVLAVITRQNSKTYESENKSDSVVDITPKKWYIRWFIKINNISTGTAFAFPFHKQAQNRFT